MFSRRLLLFAVLAMFSAGCSLYEGPPPVRKKEFNQGALGCLKDFNAKLVLYFDGKSSPAEVNRLADCSISALRTFGDLVRGENRDRFTAKEVRDFMQRYFLDDVKVSDDLLREMMRVKQALVGGQITDFTPNDLKEGEGLVNVFRDVLLQMLPSLPISIERVKREDPAYVDAEAQAVSEIGDLFGRRITERDSTYGLEELGRLFDEIGRAFPGAASTMARIRDNLKIAGVLKEILISPDHPRGVVTAAEWKVIFQDGSRWLGNYLKYINLEGRFPDWSRGDGRTRFSTVLGESLDLLDRVVSRHCPKAQITSRGGCRVAPSVSFKLVQEVMENLDWDGTIGGVQFEKATLRKLVEPFFQHFLAGTDPTRTGRTATGITSAHLDRARVVAREWVDGARYLEGVYAKLLGQSNFPENATLSTKDILAANTRDVLRENGGVTEAAVTTADGLRKSFGKTIALMSSDSPGAVFDGKNKTRARVYRELARYTWLRPLLKIAVLGYMKGDEVGVRAKRVERDGLYLPELRDMIADYWALLLDMKLVGPRNSADGDSKNRFREAALFTPVSDGNDLIGIEEGVQLVLGVFSGDPMGRAVHDRALKFCTNGPLDDYGQPTIEPECFRKKIFDFRTSNRDGEDLWRAFPILVHFYESLEPSDQAGFQSNLETAIRKAGMKPEDYFGSDDSDTIPMLFHYAEHIFLRFDTDADGSIDRKEAEVAFPIFKATLADLSGVKADDPKLPSVFYYLLAKGGPPIDDSMGAWSRFWRSAGFLWWHATKPGFKANRMRLVEVFATLSTPRPNGVSLR